MKRLSIFLLILTFFFLFLFGGKILEVKNVVGINLKNFTVIFDFPEGISGDEVNYLRSYLGFNEKNFYNLKDGKFPPQNLKGTVLYFRVFGNFREEFFKKFLNLSKNSIFSEKRIKFGDVDEKGSDLSAYFVSSNRRLCFIGKNVYDLIYMLRRFDFSNNMSCYLFDKCGFSESFIYDEKYSYITSYVPVYFCDMDLDYFFEKLKEVHPRLLAYITPYDYMNLREKLYNEVAIKSRDGYIKLKDFLHILYYGAAFFKEGHTSIQTKYSVNEKNSKNVGFLPFLLKYVNGKFYVGEGIGDLKNFYNREILKVNNKPVKDFLKPILDCCSGEKLSFKIHRFLTDEPFFFSLTEILRPREKLALKFSDGKELSISTIGVKEYLKLWEKREGKKSSEIISRFYDGKRICYFYLPEFKNSVEFRRKIKEIFKEAVKNGSKALIIDIRGNEGGNSDLGEYIASFLTRKKIESFSGAELKYSGEVIDNFFPTTPSEIKGLSLEEFEKPYSPEKVPFLFKGKVYLLIDNGVFSSASAFSALFKDFKLGKLIGYETGGLPSSFGDVFPMMLPYTKIHFGVSWKRFYRPKFTPSNLRRGVIPDVKVSEKILKKYGGERDPFLAFVLDYVRKEIK